MSLNDSLSELERSKLAVWDYPVSDKYTKVGMPRHQGRFVQAVWDNPVSDEYERVSLSSVRVYIHPLRYNFSSVCPFNPTQKASESF